MGRNLPIKGNGLWAFAVNRRKQLFTLDATSRGRLDSPDMKFKESLRPENPVPSSLRLAFQEYRMSRLICFPAMVLFFLCPAYAQSNAVLRSSGAVKVNGISANNSTVVMEGDRIDTDKHSSAFLLLPGRMISLGASSSGVFHNGNFVPNVASAKDKGKDAKDKGDNDNDKDKKKCISPKKPGRDKDCDDDGDDDHDNGH